MTWDNSVRVVTRKRASIPGREHIFIFSSKVRTPAVGSKSVRRIRGAFAPATKRLMLEVEHSPHLTERLRTRVAIRHRGSDLPPFSTREQMEDFDDLRN
jgi:hypothetical protein